jgi:two-component system CheB/CheR fusion protein
VELEHEVPGETSRVLRVIAHAVHQDRQPWLLIVVEDITEMKRIQRVLTYERDQLSGEVLEAAAALNHTKQELMTLAARLFTTQEEERRRISRELHDDVSQKLALLDIDMGRLLQNLPPVREETQQAFEDLRQRAAGLAQEVRKISHALHPSILEDLGLPHALKSLVEDFGEREGMVATFSRRRLPDGIPLDVATTLYRITQEGLRNVAKHAGKTHVKVLLQGTNGGLRLIIRDSGEGFDVTETAKHGLGLISMQERARLVNGALEIESELGEGTTLTVNVPLPAPEGV